jgi:outer membrane protein assembly factor BamA
MATSGYVVYPTLLLFSFVIFPCALLGDASSYEGKTIARIVFVPRDQPVDPEELHRILPVKERTPLRLDDIRAAIARLYATGTYADIQVDAELRNGDLILRFITQNKWFIGRVAVRGQLKSPPSAGQLANASRLSLGEVETDDKMRQAVTGIQQLLKSNGYYQAVVEPRFSYDQRTDPL